MKRLALICAMGWLISACGPVPPPKNPYTEANQLVSDLLSMRGVARSFRITGKVDHFGSKQRVQGKVYLFSEGSGRLRVDVLSPFGSSLNVLVVDAGRFALSDKREGRFLTGPAEPCAIERFLGVPLPPEEIIRILVGSTSLLDGPMQLAWDRDGYYRVTIEQGELLQTLHVGASRKSLPLLYSRLEDSGEVIWEIRYSLWELVEGLFVPHEIEISIPRQDAELLLRYDPDGVELNVELPSDAWTLVPPSGVETERFDCSSD